MLPRIQHVISRIQSGVWWNIQSRSVNRPNPLLSFGCKLYDFGGINIMSLRLIRYVFNGCHSQFNNGIQFDISRTILAQSQE